MSGVYKGFAEGLPRGEMKAVRVMEQISKTVNRTWNGGLDQGPLARRDASPHPGVSDV